MFVDDDALGVAAISDATEMFVRRIESERHVWAELLEVTLAICAGAVGIDHATHRDEIVWFVFANGRTDLGYAADDLAHTCGLPRETVQVIYNPVINPAVMAVAREKPDHPWLAAGEPPVILGVGRLTAQKDFPTLIRAFAEVRKQQPTRLIILGEGEDRPRLEALADELRVRPDVDLPGFRRDAMAFMARSALFVLSSAFEGLPTVLIEALAAGTAVVSTDCPSGPREILQDGRLGRLVPVGDPVKLAEAMLDTLRRPPGPISAEMLAPFTRDVAVDHYLRLIESA